LTVERELTGGGATTTVDVKIERPEPIVVEVCYRSRHGAMARKLQAILHNGYSCYVVCVVDGTCEPRHTPAEFDQSLQQYAVSAQVSGGAGMNEREDGSQAERWGVEVDGDT